MCRMFLLSLDCESRRLVTLSRASNASISELRLGGFCIARSCYNPGMTKPTRKKPAAKKTAKRKPSRDQSQIALSVVEKAIGGKLADTAKQ